MKRLHIDISLTEEQDRELKEKAKDRGMCKTDYARMKLFSGDYPVIDKEEPESRVLTVKEFAKRVHISESIARKLCHEHKIEYYRIGNSIRIKEEEIEKLKQREAEQEEDAGYFSTKQAANFLVVTRQTINKYIRRGELDALLVNGRYLIPKEEIEKFVVRQRSIHIDSTEALLSTRQAANILDVTKPTVIRMIKDGTLDARIEEGRYLIPKGEVEKFAFTRNSTEFVI